MSRYIGQLSVGAPTGDVQRRDESDCITHLDPGYCATHCNHDACGLVAQAARELGFL